MHVDGNIKIPWHWIGQPFGQRVAKGGESAKNTSNTPNSGVPAEARRVWARENAGRNRKKMVFNEKENEKNRIDTFGCTVFDALTGVWMVYCMQVNACMCVFDRVLFHTYCRCLHSQRNRPVYVFAGLSTVSVRVWVRYKRFWCCCLISIARRLDSVSLPALAARETVCLHRINAADFPVY